MLSDNSRYLYNQGTSNQETDYSTNSMAHYADKLIAVKPVSPMFG
jgi:hypothetical protein